ncbi:MAG: type II toxin-antitoxin system VapC family toxin [Rhodospirillaceae bacterium]|nr:type II toxin-antitoxin system VapC family toxin [Rhodospirillaceae bacterium]
MNYLLDTNVCSAVINGTSESVRRRFATTRRFGHDIWLSPIVVHELWFGVACSKRRSENSARLRDFLVTVGNILELDADDARIGAEIRAALASAGTPIGPYDLLIGAQAVARGFTLVTANAREYARIPGLAWEDWSAT